MGAISKILQLKNMAVSFDKKLDRILLLLGKLESKYAKEEFSVYSQWGEDGIIQNLLRQVEIPNKTFVEFGVENYLESNTRFLLQKDNWSGLVMDSSPDHVDTIRNSELYWKYNLKAETALVTKDNINELLRKNGLSGDVGLLSVDIDGNDYWIWQAIHSISPRIVVCEYNSTFGRDRAVTIPYQADFFRTKAHYSNLYYGCSLRALETLAEKKGYVLVGSNSAGNNAFFIRKDVIGTVTPKTSKEAYVKSSFRESRSQGGELTFLDFEARQKEIKDLLVYDLENEKLIPISELMSI
ncbi:MAG: hypothetical protein AB7F43_03785 [Bacteriovoracia bacterium]